MFLFYLDESGNTGSDLSSVDQPIHWLLTLGVSPQGVRSIEQAMSALALRYFRSRARQPKFEFHGNHIFSGRGECRLIAPAHRVTLYGELVSLVGMHGGRLFIRGIHKARHAERANEKGYEPEHPHKLAFQFLIERLDAFLEDQQPKDEIQASSPPPVLGLIVADEQKEVDRVIIRSFAFWRSHGTGLGFRARDLHYLLDTVHYVPSHDSWLIQLADCLAFLRSRYARVLRSTGPRKENWSQSERAVVRLWREMCQPYVVSGLVWP